MQAVPFLLSGSSWGDESQYMRQYENDLLVMVQVETPKGVQSYFRCAAIKGIDAIF
jgi:2-keto-3-deoxy-L-rhamnonate aldolase RhmA